MRRNPPNFTCAKALLKEKALGKAKTRERKVNLERVAFETSSTDMLLRNLALTYPKVREKGKANLSPKERGKLPNLEIEERENLALLPLTLLVPLPTHPSHEDSATKMGTPLTVVGED